MANTEKIENRITLLKKARLQMLQLHKVLIDIEKLEFEKTHGEITSGQFLNLLINDQSFNWLRNFSTMIVGVDEMLDLDDGYTELMIETHLSNMRNLLNLVTHDEEFKEKYTHSLRTNPEIAVKHSELKKLLAQYN